MKHLLVLSAVTGLLVTMLSPSWAGVINTSKSNTFRVGYDTACVNPGQAAAIVAELDKAGRTVGAGQVTEILKKQGVPVGCIKKIVIQPGKPRYTVLLLTNPADEARALAVVDEGVPNEKPAPKK